MPFDSMPKSDTEPSLMEVAESFVSNPPATAEDFLSMLKDKGFELTPMGAEVDSKIDIEIGPEEGGEEGGEEGPEDEDIQDLGGRAKGMPNLMKVATMAMKGKPSGMQGKPRKKDKDEDKDEDEDEDGGMAA